MLIRELKLGDVIINDDLTYIVFDWNGVAAKVLCAGDNFTDFDEIFYLLKTDWVIRDGEIIKSCEL